MTEYFQEEIYVSTVERSHSPRKVSSTGVTKSFPSEVGMYQREELFTTFRMVRSIDPTCVRGISHLIFETR